MFSFSVLLAASCVVPLSSVLNSQLSYAQLVMFSLAVLLAASFGRRVLVLRLPYPILPERARDDQLRVAPWSAGFNAQLSCKQLVVFSFAVLLAASCVVSP